MIFSALTASLFLLQASPAPAQKSQLVVEDDHVHSWQSVMSSDTTKAWIDTNWRSSIEHEQKTYPVFLVRSIISVKDDQTVSDFTMAIDCSGQQVALVEVWLELDGSAGQKLTMPAIDFDPETDDSSDQLFAYACGTPLSQ